MTTHRISFLCDSFITAANEGTNMQVLAMTSAVAEQGYELNRLTQRGAIGLTIAASTYMSRIQLSFNYKSNPPITI